MLGRSGDKMKEYIFTTIVDKSSFITLSDWRESNDLNMVYSLTETSTDQQIS